MISFCVLRGDIRRRKLDEKIVCASIVPRAEFSLYSM
jgi:hypothetical protein